jgi:hypothetical protein
MSPRTVSYGKCFLCGETLAKNAVSRHLAKCLPAREPTGQGKPVRLFHIQVEGRGTPGYWLHLEIPASDTLETLDKYLRSIWLECCGHLSAFDVLGTRYEIATTGADFSFYDEVPKSMKSARLEKVISVGDAFTHEYDFGTTTELKLRVVGEREGLAEKTKRKVRLLARNYAPDIRCLVCGESAECLYVYDYPYKPYCDKHGLERDEEGLMPIVNSPRVGDCGYTGPYDETLKFEETLPASQD